MVSLSEAAELPELPSADEPPADELLPPEHAVSVNAAVTQARIALNLLFSFIVFLSFPFVFCSAGFVFPCYGHIITPNTRNENAVIFDFPPKNY